MSNYIVDGADLTDIADAIRAKGGTSGQLQFPQGFVDAVEAIETGGAAVPFHFASGVVTPTSTSQSLTFPLPGFTYTPWYFICWVEGYESYASLKRVIVKATLGRFRGPKNPYSGPVDQAGIQEINANGNPENWSNGTTMTYSSDGLKVSTSQATYFKPNVPYSYIAIGA